MSNIAQPIEQKLTPGLLGASDAAGALGLDKYKPPILVAKRLRGEHTEERESEPAEWGKALEPIVRAKYALKTRRDVAVPVVSTVLDGWLRATPDGIVYPDIAFLEATIHEIGETKEHITGLSYPPNHIGLVQVKTCAAWLGDEWAEWIPQKYEVQVRVEMAVTDLPWCDVVCLVGGQHFAGPFRVHRDLSIEANILHDLRAFHHRVMDLGLDPDPDATEAYRAHVSSLMRPTKVVMPADTDLLAHVADWRAARQERKDAEARENEVKNYLLLRMSAAGATAVDAGELGKVSAYKTGDRMDWKAYAKYLEDNIETLSIDTVASRARYKALSKTWAVRAPSAWSKDSGAEEEDQ